MSKVSFAQLVGLPLDQLQLWCPVPLRLHPAGVPAIDAPGLEWATSRWLYWAFLWDSHLDTLAGDTTALLCHLGEAVHTLGQPRSAEVTGDAWVRTMAEWRDGYAAVMGPAACERFLGENTAWFTGMAWKGAMLGRREPPGLAEWLRMRWLKSGCCTLASATSGASGVPLTAAESADPVLQAFIRSVLLPCVLINEVLSLAMEQLTGQSSTNLVSVLRSEHGTDAATALAMIWDLYERTVGLMLTLQDRLLSDPRPSVARFVRQFPQWLPATVHFTATSARYLTVPGVRLAAPDIVLGDRPLLWDPEDHTPPPFPSLGWMWQV